MEDSKKSDNSASDKTPKVTGIGGIFFFSDNPKETKDWYAKNLGLDVNDWGSTFNPETLIIRMKSKHFSGVLSRREMIILHRPKKSL
jgi:hypothetical protein